MALMALDQAPAYKKSEYNSFFIIIESLDPKELNLFLRCLKKENSKLYDAYMAKDYEIRLKVEKERQEHFRKKEEEQKKIFKEKWGDGKFLIAVKRICGDLCGVLLNDKGYFKELNLEQSVDYGLGVLGSFSGGHDRSTTIPFFIDMLQDQISHGGIFSHKIEFNSEKFYLFTSKDNRKNWLKNKKKQNEESSKKLLNQGYRML